MPYAQNNNTKIYYETQGLGEPLILIAGLGGSHKSWRRILPYLTEKYQVIIFDNRGAGDTVFADEPFSIPLMASDAKSVLDAENIRSSHILGMSMGGMIAQEFALNYPEMTRSLSLTVTSCGGSEAASTKPEVLFALQGHSSESPEEAFWAMAPFIYAKGTPRNIIAEDLASREGKFAAPKNFMRQFGAIISWKGTHSRLSKINVPTMVLSGENDQLIPPVNSKILAEAIPNSRLVELENSSHIFTTDQTERSAEIILGFLSGN